MLKNQLLNTIAKTALVNSGNLIEIRATVRSTDFKLSK